MLRPSFADGREIDPNEAQISSLNPEIWRISASPASNDLRRRDLVGSAGIRRDLPGSGQSRRPLAGSDFFFFFLFFVDSLEQIFSACIWI
jgi:hypothetical protein